MSKLDEVDHIGGNNGPSFSRCVGELGPIVQLNVADLVGRGRVYAMLSNKCSNDGR